jgi:hypothetical protein
MRRFIHAALAAALALVTPAMAAFGAGPQPEPPKQLTAQQHHQSKVTPRAVSPQPNPPGRAR